MAAVPIQVLLLDAIVGQGGAEVAPRGGDGVRLRVLVLADDLQVAKQDRGALLGAPDRQKVLEQGAVANDALSLGWLISFTYRRLIANPAPPLLARGEPQWAEAQA